MFEGLAAFVADFVLGVKERVARRWFGGLGKEIGVKSGTL